MRAPLHIPRPPALVALVLTACALAAPVPALAGIDLAASVDDTPDPAVAGDTLTETGTLRNVGDVSVGGAQLSFNLLDDVSLVAAPGCTTLPPLPLAVCQFGELVQFPPGASATFKVLVGTSLPGTVNVRATASFATPSPGVDVNQANDAANATTTLIPRADLRLELTAAPESVVAGQTVSVTARIYNSASGPGTDARLRLALPPELTPVDPPDGCAMNGGALVCALGAIEPLGQVSRVIALRGSISGFYSVIATTLWARADPTPLDTQAQAQIGITDPPEPPAPPEPVPAPRAVRAATLVRGLPARGCLHGRVLRLTPRLIGGVNPRQVRVTLAGGTARTLSGPDARAPFTLRLPRARRGTIRLSVTLVGGARLTATLPYRLCASAARR